MPFRERVRKVLHKLSKDSKDPQPRSNGKFVSKTPEPVLLQQQFDPPPSTQQITEPHRDSGAASPPPSIPRQRVTTPKYSGSEGARSVSSHNSPQNGIPSGTIHQTNDYGSFPKAISEVGSVRMTPQDSGLDNDRRVKTLSAFGPFGTDEPSLPANEALPGLKNTPIEEQEDDWRLSTSEPSKEDRPGGLAFTRTATRTSVNTWASSDYDGHSTTQSLGPSPVPSSGKRLVENFRPDSVAFQGLKPRGASLDGDLHEGMTEGVQPTSALNGDVPKVAIVHERIRPVETEERFEVITREIHKHEVNTRIQPIVDRTYLPTIHYLETESGELVEISADEAEKYGEPISKSEHVVAGDSIAEEFPDIPLEPVSDSMKVDPMVNAMESLKLNKPVMEESPKGLNSNGLRGLRTSGTARCEQVASPREQLDEDQSLIMHNSAVECSQMARPSERGSLKNTLANKQQSESGENDICLNSGPTPIWGELSPKVEEYPVKMPGGWSAR
ncbi:hypothetical protein EDC01DRAFT_632797 [Geopyxis carbonaria]|nr:hypothetical protein EDC01DRAFT_632797 [Geopyxis carbonaria]